MTAFSNRDGQPIEEGVKAQIGDSVALTNQLTEVVACQETGVPMLNIDADQLAPGDLSFIKKIGLTISNPETDAPVALGVDYNPDTFGEKVHKFFSSESDDDDDDSSFFHSSSSGSGGSSFSFGGGSSFGGFGGGSFSGGGASGGF